MARPGFEPTIIQSKANSQLDHEALRRIAPKSEIMKNKRNKKLNKNVMNWGQILSTVQQKPTNFNILNSFD